MDDLEFTFVLDTEDPEIEFEFQETIEILPPYDLEYGGPAFA